MLEKNGGRIYEQGHVCLSKKRRNSVISNVIGAAAYFGNASLLKYLLTLALDVNFPAEERQDQASKTTFFKEYSGFTPMMLAVVGGDRDCESIKQLIQRGARATIEDFQGNNVLHIAVIYGNVYALKYLTETVPSIDVFGRNHNGDTPLSLAKEKKNKDMIAILEQLELQDPSKAKVFELLEDVEKEEIKEEAKKLKKKEKKKRQKLRQIAEREGMTIEQVEEKLKAEEEAQRKAEEEQREAE